MKNQPPEKQEILGQSSWRIFSDKVTAAITERGGHLAPVKFRLGGRIVAPFSVAPWAEEKIAAGTPEVLRCLRGDFFCAPFGGNATSYRGEKHPPHGDAANARWRFESCAEQTLHLSLRTRMRPGRVDKFIGLRNGETNLYCRHVISQMEGAMSFGHHAMLKFPKPDGSGIVSTSRLLYGQVAPQPFESPASGGYQSLKPGSRITRLDRVRTSDGKFADLRRYPARQGFEDIVMLVHESEPDFAWTAVTFPKEHFVWFSLKDPRVLRSTVLWISNGGRHYPPWNGRHLGVMGIEDVTSYFHHGLAKSARGNPVNRAGFPTCVKLKKTLPLTINYIMGVAAIPAGFGGVRTIHRESGGIVLSSPEGKHIKTTVNTEFLQSL